MPRDAEETDKGVPPREDNATSLEFEGGTTRRGPCMHRAPHVCAHNPVAAPLPPAGKVVLGVLCCALLFAVGVPKEGVGLSACGFGYWAFAYEDNVAKQYAEFKATAKQLGASSAKQR